VVTGLHVVGECRMKGRVLGSKTCRVAVQLGEVKKWDRGWNVWDEGRTAAGLLAVVIKVDLLPKRLGLSFAYDTMK
jgi:hypothetical protein